MITSDVIAKAEKCFRKNYLSFLVKSGFCRAELTEFGFHTNEISRTMSKTTTCINCNATVDDMIKNNTSETASLVVSAIPYRYFFDKNPFETTLQLLKVTGIELPPSPSLHLIRAALKYKDSPKHLLIEQDGFDCKDCGKFNFRPDLNSRKTRRKYKSCDCAHCGAHHDHEFFYQLERSIKKAA